MKRYNDYMDRQTVSPELHERLLALEKRSAPKKKVTPLRRYAPVAVLAAGLCLVVGLTTMTRGGFPAEANEKALYSAESAAVVTDDDAPSEEVLYTAGATDSAAAMAEEAVYDADVVESAECEDAEEDAAVIYDVDEDTFYTCYDPMQADARFGADLALGSLLPESDTWESTVFHDSGVFSEDRASWEFLCAAAQRYGVLQVNLYVQFREAEDMWSAWPEFDAGEDLSGQNYSELQTDTIAGQEVCYRTYKDGTDQPWGLVAGFQKDGAAYRWVGELEEDGTEEQLMQALTNYLSAMN